MRIAKWTAIILGGVLLLLVVTAFVLTSVVNPNRYRGKVEAIVADLTGKPFVIEGDLKITWYPWLGISTGPAHLDEPAMLEWQSMSVAAKLWPLVHGEFVVDRVRLRSPHIHLRRDAQGHGNWEDLGGGSRTAAVAPAGTSGSAGSTSGSAAGNSGPAAGTSGLSADGSATGTATGRPAKPSRPVEIAGIEIYDGTVDYVDAKTGQQATLSKVDLDVGEWHAGQPVPVHTRLLAHTQSLPPDGVWIELNAPALAIRPTPISISAPKLTLKVDNAQAEGNLAYEQTTASAQAVEKPTEASGANTRAGDAHSLAANTRVHAHGTITLHSPSLRELATALALNQTLPHDPTTLGPLELTTTWSYDDGAITAKPLALKLDEVSFNGWLERTAPPKAMWGFELHGDRIDLGRYVNVDSKNKKPFELPVAALRAVNANGSVIFDQLVFADTHMTDVRLKLQTPEGNP